MSAKPPPEAVFVRAVEARAEGNSWIVVAAEVNRAPRTVRKWPLKYPERWAAALREAERRAIDDAGAEGVCVLRELIRAGDAKVRQIAAWHLIYQRLEILKHELKVAALAAPPLPEDAQRIAEFERSHTNEQFIRILAGLLKAGIPKCIVIPAIPTDSAADPCTFIRACLTDSSGAPIDVAPVHERLQQFLTDNPRALVELPRDHGKSVQVCGRILWELGNNPALRVKVVCATESVATERSRFLRDAIADNLCVREMFPHLRPGKPWAADGFTIERPANVIGPSVAAFGIGAGSTGTRADLLICDDVVDVRSLHSKAERDRGADYFANNLMNLLEPNGRFWGLFTPWHLDDLNARLKRNPAYSVMREAVGADFEPVWSEKWPAEKLRARKEEIGSQSYARGYRLVPVADEDTPIRPAWVQFWDEPAEHDMVVLAVDPAVSVATRADRSALVVLGRTTRPNPPTPFPTKEGGFSESPSPLGGGVGEGSASSRPNPPTPFPTKEGGANQSPSPGGSQGGEKPSSPLGGGVGEGSASSRPNPPTPFPTKEGGANQSPSPGGSQGGEKPSSRPGGGVGEGSASARPNPPTPFPTKEGGANQSPSPGGSQGGEKPSSPPGGGVGEGSFCAPQIRVLAALARRVAAPELVGLIEEFDRVWNPAVILFETNGAFQGIKDLLARHARFGPKLKSVTQTADKAARVAAFSVVVENGSFRLQSNGKRTPGPIALQRELWEEMITFPFADRDDLVDAAAMGCAWLLDRREPRVW